MDSHTTSEMTDDLSALAWVHEELRKSLDNAHKALHRFVKESEAIGGSDVDAADAASLRTARQQIHQGVGALELIGLPAAAVFLRACENAVQRFAAKPEKLKAEDVETIEFASFALLDYLQRMLSGKQMSPVALFSRYQAVQTLAGAERAHPADLWMVDWRWLEFPREAGVTPHAVDDAARDAIERELLKLMRGQDGQAALTMSDICASLAAGSATVPAATFWRLASAFFESQSQGLLQSDLYSKRVAARMLSQMRVFERGESAVSERLAQDLLFYCAQSRNPADPSKATRITAVREAYGLTQYVATDYETNRLGRFDPAVIAQARKRVSSAKEAWSAVAGGELHRVSSLGEQFSLVGDSVKNLYPSGDLLADEIQQAISYVQETNAAPPPSLAMEVATSVLYLEASLEDGEFDDPEESKRVRRLALRIASVRAGNIPDPLEAWMEELYRRVSDRQTMGSVVQELRASLSEAEKYIDQFFRNPAGRDVLAPVPALLASMRGVLSVLGIDQAAHAVLRMRDDVDGLLGTEIDPEHASQEGSFDRLASNLGALGFLIDMLSVQPQMAKSLFVFDSAAGTLSPLMGRSAAARASNLAVPTLPLVEPRLIEQAQSLAFAAASDNVPLDEVERELEHLSHEAQVADQPTLIATVEAAQEAIEQATDAQGITAAREQLSEALSDFVNSMSEPMGLDPLVAIAPPSPQPLSHATAGDATDLGEDPEMREIFLEEAREVVQTAKGALEQLATSPSNLEQLTTVRRSFHTFKGSSRMVGLKEFGDAAWICEQIYNSWLAEQKPADGDLLGFSNYALDYFSAWVEGIAVQQVSGFNAATIQNAADALAGGKPQPHISSLGALAAAAEAQPAISLPADLPSAQDLDFSAPSDQIPVAEASPLPEVSFDLDLDVGGEPAQGKDAQSNTLSFELPTIEEQPLPAAETVENIELDLSVGETFQQSQEPLTPSDDDQVKVVGDLRISIPLFNIYLNEADELSRRLATDLSEWSMELHRPIGEGPIAMAHSLAGNSATVGYTDLSHLARLVEHALTRSNAIGQGTTDEARLFLDAAEEIRRLLHQFAAGFLKPVTPELLQRLAEHEVSSAHRLEASNVAQDSVTSQLDPVPAYEPPAEPEPSMPVQAEAVPESQPEPQPEPPVARHSRPAPLNSRPAPLHSRPAPLHSRPAPLTNPEALTAHVDSNFGTLDTDVGVLGHAEFKPLAEMPPEAPRVANPIRIETLDGEDDLDAVDAVDADLFPIFEEEAEELLPELDASLREWARRPNDNGPAAACMRTLHTLKGGARLAGAMRLGELAHRLETMIERVTTQGSVANAAEVETLHARSDALAAAFDTLRSRDAQAYANASDAVQAAVAAEPAPAPAPVAQLPEFIPDVVAPLPVTPALVAVQPPPVDAIAIEPEPAAPPAPVMAPAPSVPSLRLVSSPSAPAREIDWSRFSASSAQEVAQTAADRAGGASNAAVRVRGQLLERLVNQAGEVSITRSRIESEVGNIRGSLGDLTDNLERLRQQLRDIEFQAETQMISRQEAAKAAQEAFDPLESDRFTRFQELTRMMAESVNDVATVQRTLQRTLETTEDELASQARLTRDLQDDLLRTRMVEFEGQSDRLYRVVRLAAKETGKQVRLDIVGGSIEIDRGVLDRMMPAFEHLLRNCVSHGIEQPDVRTQAGKDPIGSIVVALHHEGNEVAVEFRDDGAGLDLARIRAKGIAMNLIGKNDDVSDADLANLIFMPGFSTAEKVTELAGRGVGMDVVRSEVNAMGGRIETSSAAAKGTNFKLVLPLTTAVTQVVMIRCGTTVVAIPATLIEIVRRASAAELELSYATGQYTMGERGLLFFWMGALLQAGAMSLEPIARSRPVIVVRSAQQRIALHVDEVLGTQEVVVKNLGPQLSRLPGLAGMTLLASGSVALIYNPVALATLYGESARAATQAAMRVAAGDDSQSVATIDEDSAPQAAPLILVVDDSLTVRRVTQRLLVREGYRVVLAKDGIEALEQLADELPTVVLSDIEMPRMDGFDLVRNIRGDTRLRSLPVIMITSRIAQKHRDYAAELGVDHYLGKPYSEEDLLAIINRYTSVAAPA